MTSEADGEGGYLDNENLYRGNMFYVGDFDKYFPNILLPVAEAIREQRDLVKTNGEGFIDLHITSWGGRGDYALHLVDLIENAKDEGITVRTYVPACAYSAGSMVAVAGSPGHRFIARRAKHLVHYGTVWNVTQTPLQLERERAWAKSHFDDVIAHYEYYCDIPDLEEKIADDSFFIKATDCVRWGLADGYSTDFTV